MIRQEALLQLDSHASWLGPARLYGGQHWVANAPCTVCCSDAGTPPIPVTRLSAFSAQDSDVASARSVWVRHAQGKAQRKRPPLNTLAQLATLPVSSLITASRLDQAAIVNNWLIPTNLHPDWSDSDLSLLTESVITRHSDVPLMLRNINDAANPGLRQRLAAQGWTLLPVRKVYTCNPQTPAIWQLPHVMADQALLDQDDLTICPPSQLCEADLPDLHQCVRGLFIDKNPALCPDFTPAFYALCLQSRFLSLHALRYGGRVVAVIGLYQRYGWLCAALTGYDKALAALGLYRRLMALMLREAKARQLQLHYGSGAGTFKQHRGAIASQEYSAVYNSHLPGRQRLALSSLASIL